MTGPKVLVVLNRASGVGHAAGIADDLASALRAGYAGTLDVAIEVVDDHPQARRVAAAFVESAPLESLLVAAGGGGSLRAVVEGGLGSAASIHAVRFAALRMGSGNVVARNLGMPLDPVLGAGLIGESLRSGVTRAVGVIRCRFGDGGSKATAYAVTMCGLGQWGRVPGDIERWRATHASARRRAAGLVGLERVNTVEYVGLGAMRLAAGAIQAARCDLVELDGRRMRLLAGVVMNMPLPGLPDPRVEIGEAAAGAVLVPRFGRPIRRRVEPGRPLRLTFIDPTQVEFFLDEDPEHATGSLEIDIAGTATFVPGHAA
ncbi:MAG TPA: diacylglycerol kinase family protein [Candidatus Limnocylindrales bacterium]|nr:diacylglycerol kinase family protein [Candidatus Limnocylindrales bacterium]